MQIFLQIRQNRKEFFILLLCLLIGFALRFYTFDQKSLWLDEVHTFNDSRDDLKGQIKFYKENPTFLHPPLFFILTHLFYPFAKPERDLRIIPLIFGTLSIPMIYLLAGSFSPLIALPCALSSDLHGLPHQPLSGWPLLFTAHVPWNGWSLLLYETPANIKEEIPLPGRILFRYLILYQLQLYSLYCPFPDSLALSDRGKRQRNLLSLLSYLKWSHFSLLSSLDPFCHSQIIKANP